VGTRIILADDHEIVRRGLRAIIEEQPETEIVAEATNGREALEQVGRLRPHIVVMDISMPDLNGLEATRKIKKDYPEVKVIALSMHRKRQFVIDMLKAGVSGYVLKADVSHDLIHALEAALNNRAYLSPQIADVVAEDYVRGTLPEAQENASTVLTARQREILQLIAEGKATKEIALHLKVSVKTIESTRQRIMAKLNIDNTAALVKYAISEGLTTLDY